MKTITIFNKIRNNISYYAFLLTSHFILLYLIIVIIYSLLFIYFFADPILCQGNEITDVKELMDSTESSKSGSAGSVYAKQENSEGNASHASHASDNILEMKETFPLSTLAQEARAGEVREQSLRDPEISNRL